MCIGEGACDICFSRFYSLETAGQVLTFLFFIKQNLNIMRQIHNRLCAHNVAHQYDANFQDFCCHNWYGLFMSFNLNQMWQNVYSYYYLSIVLIQCFSGYPKTLCIALSHSILTQLPRGRLIDVRPPNCANGPSSHHHLLTIHSASWFSPSSPIQVQY